MMAIIEGRDPETVDNYGATKEDGGRKLFRPSVPDVIEKPARHIHITSEPIPMPEEPDDAGTPAEETPDAPPAEEDTPEEE